MHFLHDIHIIFISFHVIVHVMLLFTCNSFSFLSVSSSPVCRVDYIELLNYSFVSFLYCFWILLLNFSFSSCFMLFLCFWSLYLNLNVVFVLVKMFSHSFFVVSFWLLFWILSYSEDFYLKILLFPIHSYSFLYFVSFHVTFYYFIFVLLLLFHFFIFVLLLV